MVNVHLSNAKYVGKPTSDVSSPIEVIEADKSRVLNKSKGPNMSAYPDAVYYSEEFDRLIDALLDFKTHLDINDIEGFSGVIMGFRLSKIHEACDD